MWRRHGSSRRDATVPKAVENPRAKTNRLDLEHSANEVVQIPAFCLELLWQLVDIKPMRSLLGPNLPELH